MKQQKQNGIRGDADHTAFYPRGGVNAGEPFLPGSGGSGHFRIPALYMLADGSLLAAADARWNHTCDGAHLSTLVSRSEDGGAVWEHHFANYFGDSVDAYTQCAASFIDPALLQDDSGTVYLLTDLWPGGTALGGVGHSPAMDCTGYLDADGDGRPELVLYEGSGLAEGQKTEDYAYYVGDFGEDGFAPVCPRADGAVSASGRKRGVETAQAGQAEEQGAASRPPYYIDRWYYLYDASRRPVTCARLLESDKDRWQTMQEPSVGTEQIHANVFFYQSPLHVRAVIYLWLVRSSDGGRTWSAPQIVSPQVRTGENPGNWFYGVGPGRGLAVSCGSGPDVHTRLLFPCYTHSRGIGDGRTSVIYSDDGGLHWKKSGEAPALSSEAALAELDGRIYMFSRHGAVSVSDDWGETWRAWGCWPEGLHTECQISAVTYSRPVGGKRVILLSGPSDGGRINGKIWVGSAGGDGKLVWKCGCRVTENGGWYGYSCLTELPDGSVGLLYESGNGAIRYRTLKAEELFGAND